MHVHTTSTKNAIRIMGPDQRFNEMLQIVLSHIWWSREKCRMLQNLNKDLQEWHFAFHSLYIGHEWNQSRVKNSNCHHYTLLIQLTSFSRVRLHKETWKNKNGSNFPTRFSIFQLAKQSLKLTYSALIHIVIHHSLARPASMLKICFLSYACSLMKHN
mgnify:CR=1 FL=1